MITIRSLTTNDTNFVVNAWVNSYYAFMTGYKPNQKIFNVMQRRLILDILKESSCYIACNKDDNDQIMGFIVVGNDDTLHYVFTKEIFEREGIATMLIKSVNIEKPYGISCSHITRQALNKLKGFKLRYNPFKLMGVDDEN